MLSERNRREQRIQCLIPLYKLSEIGKSIETENEFLGLERKGTGVDENSLELGSGDGCTTL